MDYKEIDELRAKRIRGNIETTTGIKISVELSGK